MFICVHVTVGESMSVYICVTVQLSYRIIKLLVIIVSLCVGIGVYSMYICVHFC